MNKELIDLRKKNIDQLNAELISERESQFSLRIKHKTGQLNETSELKKVRRKIAMIKTVINEMKRKDKE
jgi:large subunit ribosomal protein L29|tara:strand:+ start:1277 stop:1483 length:207 start_codon:yes stop_codon:yes gene_type:complete